MSIVAKPNLRTHWISWLPVGFQNIHSEGVLLDKFADNFTFVIVFPPSYCMFSELSYCCRWFTITLVDFRIFISEFSKYLFSWRCHHSAYLIIYE